MTTGFGWNWQYGAKFWRFSRSRGPRRRFQLQSASSAEHWPVREGPASRLQPLETAAAPRTPNIDVLFSIPLHALLAALEQYDEDREEFGRGSHGWVAGLTSFDHNSSKSTNFSATDRS